jgi:hypothetical protein
MLSTPRWNPKGIIIWLLRAVCFYFLRKLEQLVKKTVNNLRRFDKANLNI